MLRQRVQQPPELLVYGRSMLEMLNLMMNSFDVYEVTYKGQGLGWNEFYAGGGGRAGWRVRKAKVDKYHKIFDVLIREAKLPWFDEYAIVLQYRSKHDPDNVLALGKCFLDVLKQDMVAGKIVRKGYCTDDSTKYCKMVTSVYDSKLAVNEFIFKIIKIK
jgi:hypothetical protein